MGKSGNRIHGSLRPRQQSAFGTKKFLVELMNDRGWDLIKSEVIDPGEWNERHEWVAMSGDRNLRVELGSTLNTMNWRNATDFFLREGLGMSRREIDHAEHHWG